MKIETDPNQVVLQSQDFEQVTCTIDAEDMRFVAGLLRNNYSNTILAVIREISANALDANKEYEEKHGKKARQVEINLPSRMSPILSVRDFGEGLSKEDMFGLYSKYGKSTKRNSNSMIGGFGIGKFAPLSYGDNFTVVSYHGGEKASFNVFVDENDDTKVLEMLREPSDEPTGLRVEVTASDNEVETFIQTAKEFFKIFPKDEMPKFLGRDDNFISQPDTIFEGKDWFLSDESNGYHYGRHNAYAVMGRVRYPLNEESITFGEDDDDAHAIRELLSTRGFYVNFEIGELKLHHSRESLEYNKSTQAKIIERLREVYEDLSEHAKDKLANSKDYWEAKMNHAVVMNSLPNGVRRVLGTAFKWNGHEVDGARFDKPQWTYVYHGANTKKKKEAEENNKVFKAVELRLYEKRSDANVSDGFKVMNSEVNSVYASKDTSLLKCDIDTHGMALRIRTFFRENADKNRVYLVRVTDSEGVAVQKKAEKWLEDNWHVDEMEDENYQPVSNFDKAKIAKKKGVGGSKSRANVKLFKLSSDQNIVDVSPEDAETLIEEAEENDKKILFLPIYRFKIEHSEKSHDEMIKLIKALRMEDAFDKDIYCIRVSDAKKLDDTWEDAYPALKAAVLNALKAESKELGDYLMKEHWNAVNWYSYDISALDGNPETLRHLKAKLGDNHELFGAYKVFKERGGHRDMNRTIFEYKNLFSDAEIKKIAKVDKRRVTRAEKEMKEVSEKYTLLFAYCRELSHWKTPEPKVLKAIVEYVKMIDAK